MSKKCSIVLAILVLCFTVSAVSACGTITSLKSVFPEQIYLEGSGCVPDETTVTIEVTGFGQGWCFSPRYVKLVEVTESYIVREADFSIPPDSVVENGDGTTTIIWKNIAQYVGNNDRFLDESETFVVSFTAGSDTVGEAMPVDTSDAKIEYTIGINCRKCEPLDQAYIDVDDCTPPSVPEFPTIAAPLGLIIGLVGLIFALRNKYFSFHRDFRNKR